MKTRILLLVVLLPILVYGQSNIVPNPGFEDTLRCSYDSTIIKSKCWYSPTIGTPDYFYPTTQFNLFCNDQWPGNWGGGGYSNNAGYQLPHGGIAYSGCVLAGGYEYIAVQLTDSMRSGKSYAISFYTSLSNWSRSGIDLVQLSFSDTSLTLYDTISGTDYFLDSIQSSAGNSSGSFLIDTLDWILIRDTLLASGGERFLTVGNFDTAQTQYYLIDSLNPSAFAYYYFDDFDVHCIDCNDTAQPPPPDPQILVQPNLGNGTFPYSGEFPENSRLRVYNMLGQIVFEQYINPGYQTGNIFLPAAAGMYVYSFEAQGKILKCGKLINGG